MKTSIIIALPEEAEDLKGYSIYLSGCGKVNATIAAMEAIDSGANECISLEENHEIQTNPAEIYDVKKKLEERI